MTDGLKAGRGRRPSMEVTCEVVGEGERTVEVEAGASYADLLRELDLSPHEATALVDGNPVPDDAAVEADRVRVLRLIEGG